MRAAAAPSACCALTARVSERSAVQLDARRCTPTALRTGYARAMLRCPSAPAPATRARSRRSGPAPTRVRAASPLRRTRALQPQRARRAAPKPPRLRHPSGAARCPVSAPSRRRRVADVCRGVSKRCSRAHERLCSFAFTRGRVRAFARVVPCMRRCVCVCTCARLCVRERVRRRAFVRCVCALMCACAHLQVPSRQARHGDAGPSAPSRKTTRRNATTESQR